MMEGEPAHSNIVTDLLRRHRSKKLVGSPTTATLSIPVPADPPMHKSLTDLPTSCDNSSSSSTSYLQLLVTQLTDENRCLKEELDRLRHTPVFSLCSGKLTKLVEEMDFLGREVEELRRKLEESNIQRDFYMRAYNGLKKENQVLVRELATKRRELQALKNANGQYSAGVPRKRTSSQSPKNLPSGKVRDVKNQQESLQDIIAVLRGEVQKAASLKNLQETLHKLETKLENERKDDIRDSVQRKEYFAQYRQSKDAKHVKR